MQNNMHMEKVNPIVNCNHLGIGEALTIMAYYQIISRTDHRLETYMWVKFINKLLQWRIAKTYQMKIIQKQHTEQWIIIKPQILFCSTSSFLQGIWEDELVN